MICSSLSLGPMYAILSMSLTHRARETQENDVVNCCNFTKITISPVPGSESHVSSLHLLRSRALHHRDHHAARVTTQQEHPALASDGQPTARYAAAARARVLLQQRAWSGIRVWGLGFGV